LRTDYSVPPGLYAVGDPSEQSPVFVSANYKMSFDRLRSVLTGRDAWVLVLDTKGINVWCAAGKGSFGTDEIIARVEASGLAGVVTHRTLVLPQLGAPGVSAHEVRKHCGFRVVYGPVRAEDLPGFLDAGMKATPDMRRVRFGLLDRVVLIPVELVGGAKYAAIMALAFLVLGGLGRHGFSFSNMRTTGTEGAALLLGTFLWSVVLGPIVLPWLPGRAFSLKGAVLGLALAAAVWAVGVTGGPDAGSWLPVAAWWLMVPALSSFVLMNFTGATTFTSMSGVMHEMRRAVPVQIGAFGIGLVLWIVGLLTRGGAIG
jgi:acetyl-CoA decarbonylase/synthase complex subunit gamma